MPSSLLTLSMPVGAHGCAPHRRTAGAGAPPRTVLVPVVEKGPRRPPPPKLLLRGRLLDVLGHHVRVGRVPVGDLDELAPLDLPDLDEPATLVVGRSDLERRHQTAESKVGDLLEAEIGRAS